jgi:hypothetical protein
LETEEEEENGKMITPELMVNTDISVNEDTVSPKRPLYIEAKIGLREILDQFQLSAGEIDEVVGSFHSFIAAASTRLFLKPILKKNRYAWTVSHDNEQIHEIVSHVAQRLEAFVCNESVTGRTNSTMKRMLSPFRLRMDPDVLLSLPTIARHGNMASPKSYDSIGSDNLAHN